MTAHPSRHTVPTPAVNRDGTLTRAVVLSAALELIDRDGPGGLSMRRLARELGRDPMTLYRHAANKAALLEAVAETVLAELEVDATDPDWVSQLREVAHQYRRLALAHPHVVPLLVTLPLSTPLALRPLGVLRPLEDIVELLMRAGFSGADALHIYRALFGFLHGHVLNELQELSRTPTRPTTCCAWACTGCRSASSRDYAAWRRSWRPTTAAPSSSGASTSSSPGLGPWPRRADRPPSAPVAQGPNGVGTDRAATR